jgi:hypothetical protein
MEEPSRARAAASSSGVGSVEDIVTVMGCGDPKSQGPGEIRRYMLRRKYGSHESTQSLFKAYGSQARRHLVGTGHVACFYSEQQGNSQRQQLTISRTANFADTI